MLFFLFLWVTSVSATAYYIDRKMPKIAKKSALIAAFLSLIPALGIGYLIYLYLTAKRRLVVNF
jgi:hypothetical protein